jgi:hypothetical protein
MVTPKYETVQVNPKTSKEHIYLQKRLRVRTVTHKYLQITTIRAI